MFILLKLSTIQLVCVSVSVSLCLFVDGEAVGKCFSTTEETGLHDICIG